MRTCLLFLLILALLPATASADNVVNDDQIVQGSLCVGTLCADGELFPTQGVKVKKADTPLVMLEQTGGGFGNQRWDVAGNETNFFVRDVTNGSRLPFRIRPLAPTSSLDVQATGEVNTTLLVQQNMSSLTSLGAADESAILTALRTLDLQRYRFNADTGDTPHLGPDSAPFRAAFSVGSSDSFIAPADMAGVALAAIKALDARVSAISLTPGPEGPQGPAGEAGPQGPAGGEGTPADASKISSLKKSNRKLRKRVKKLERKMKRVLRKL